jgi:ceramide glucosyltransferase
VVTVISFLGNAALYLAMAATIAALGYQLFAILCLARFRHHGVRSGNTETAPDVALPAATILKPVCGIDYDSYENLRSFCCQDHPNVQIVFGVKDADDPVIHVVRRLMQALPERDIALVIDSRAVGANLKISNLANMMREAKHDILIIADSDIRVGPDYARAIVGDFAEPDVGVVTCLYKASSADDVSSRLAAMSINGWFLPSALAAITLQGPKFCFGSTMAVRRDVLDGIGGFELLSTYLADDHMLGKLAAEQGYRIRLSDYLVETVVHERSLKTLFAHELRWARTIRSIQPLGHAFSFTTYCVSLALLTLVLAAWSSLADLSALPVWPAGILLGTAVLLRYVTHRIARARLQTAAPWSFWLVPARDLFSFAVWATSLFGRNVVWKGWAMSVGPNGQLTAKGISS